MKKILTLIFLLQCGAALHAQKQVDTLLTMSDGVKLDALYFLPLTPAPPAGYPAIVLVHGFSGSKNDVRAAALSYAQRGYATVGYSVRGQGASGGEFDFFTSPRILADLKALIDFAKSLPNVNATRAAVMGGSQGGIHAWSAAAHRLGVRTVISHVANGRFDENFTANGAMNWTFARAVTLANVRIQPALRDSVNKAMTTGDITFVDQMLRGYSTQPFEDSVTAPTLIMVSYFDGFFNPSTALRQFSCINAPKKILLYPAGHSQPNDQQTRIIATLVQDAWLEYWLKDVASYQSVASPDSAVIYFDAATNQPRVFAVRDSAFYLAPSGTLPTQLKPTTYFLSPAGLVTTASALQNQQTSAYNTLTGGAPLTYRSEALKNDIVVAGTFGNATLLADGNTPQLQVNLLLFDFDPATNAKLPITRGHSEIKNNVTGTIDRFDFPLNTVMHTIKAGHQIEARVHGGIPLIPNTANDFGNFVMPPIANATHSFYTGGALPAQFTIYTIASPPNAVADASSPLSISISECYPNPATDNASLTVELASARHVTAQLHDLFGRRISTLHDGVLGMGRSELSFSVSGIVSGFYFVKLNAGSYTITRRFIVR